MEAYLLTMAKVLPVGGVSRQTSVSEDRIWHLIRARVGEAWMQADWSSVERLGVDETSTRKGHKYGTVFLEINGKETKRGRGGSKVAGILFFTAGRDKENFSEFVAELDRRDVPTSQIPEIARDVSRAFIAGASEHLPDAQISFDRVHVMALCGQSRDEIRKEVARGNGDLPRGAMWALRGTLDNLKEEPQLLLAQICKEHDKIARALSMREFLADLWNHQNRDDAEKHLEADMAWCRRSDETVREPLQDAQEAHGRHPGILQQLHHLGRHRMRQLPVTTRASESQRLPHLPQLPSHDLLDRGWPNNRTTPKLHALKGQERLFFEADPLSIALLSPFSLIPGADLAESNRKSRILSRLSLGF
jgi:hypothetical protein